MWRGAQKNQYQTIQLWNLFMLLRDAPATEIRTTQMIMLQMRENYSQETGMIWSILEDWFTELTLGQSNACSWSVCKRRQGGEERQLWGSQWYRMGGGNKEKDQKSVSFKHYSSEQVFLCRTCSLSMLLGVPPYTTRMVFLLQDTMAFFAQWWLNNLCCCLPRVLQIPRVALKKLREGVKVSCHIWELVRAT